MAKIKDIFYFLILIAYFVSWSIALGDLDILNVFPLLAYIGVIFGILGGSLIFSVGVQKFRAARRRGLHIAWYTSPSIAFGTVFFLLGLETLAPVLKFMIFPTKVLLIIELTFRAIAGILIFFFLLLIFIYRHKEGE